MDNRWRRLWFLFGVVIALSIIASALFTKGTMSRMIGFVFFCGLVYFGFVTLATKAGTSQTFYIEQATGAAVRSFSRQGTFATGFTATWVTLILAGLVALGIVNA